MVYLLAVCVVGVMLYLVSYSEHFGCIYHQDRLRDIV